MTLLLRRVSAGQALACWLFGTKPLHQQGWLVISWSTRKSESKHYFRSRKCLWKRHHKSRGFVRPGVQRNCELWPMLDMSIQDPCKGTVRLGRHFRDEVNLWCFSFRVLFSNTGVSLCEIDLGLDSCAIFYFASKPKFSSTDTVIWWRSSWTSVFALNNPPVSVIHSGSAFIKPDQRNPWIKDQIKITLLPTISHLLLPNCVSCGRACPSHMTQNLVTVGAKLWTADRFIVDPWSMDYADPVW